MHFSRRLIYIIIPIIVTLNCFTCEADPESSEEILLRPGIVVDLGIDSAVVLKSETPITRISIAQEKIADISLLTPTQILVVAYGQPGETSIIIWHGDENSQIHKVRTFIPDYYREIIANSISEIVPEANVTVHIGKRGIVLKGMVEDQQQMNGVLAAAKLHVSNIINFIDVAEMLEKQIKEWEPESNVALSMGSSGIILKGETISIEQSNRIVKMVESHVRPMSVDNLLSVRGSQQVQLKVTIAEISHSNIKQMGFGYLYSGSNGGLGVYPQGSGSGEANYERNDSETEDSEGIQSAITQLSSLFTNARMNSPFSSAFQVIGQSYNDNAMGMLSLLKGKGLAKVLATPTLVTMSGQEASFLVGGEFPVPISSDEGETSIDYHSYGVQLRFLPMVVGKETITIQIEPEFSSPDLSLGTQSGGVAVPAIKTRKSKSTLQLKDGQTFVMAGLLREETSQTVNKFPLLGSIPIAGTLFTNKEWQKEETELVIIVKPSLVAALNSDADISLPGDLIDLDIDDKDFFLLNKIKTDETIKNTPIDDVSKNQDYPIDENNFKSGKETDE